MAESVGVSSASGIAFGSTSPIFLSSSFAGASICSVLAFLSSFGLAIDFLYLKYPPPASPPITAAEMNYIIAKTIGTCLESNGIAASTIDNIFNAVWKIYFVLSVFSLQSIVT